MKLVNKIRKIIQLINYITHHPNSHSYKNNNEFYGNCHKYTNQLINFLPTGYYIIKLICVKYPKFLIHKLGKKYFVLDNYGNYFEVDYLKIKNNISLIPKNNYHYSYNNQNPILIPNVLIDLLNFNNLTQNHKIIKLETSNPILKYIIVDNFIKKIIELSKKYYNNQTEKPDKHTETNSIYMNDIYYNSSIVDDESEIYENILNNNNDNSAGDYELNIYKGTISTKKSNLSNLNLCLIKSIRTSLNKNTYLVKNKTPNFSIDELKKSNDYNVLIVDCEKFLEFLLENNPEFYRSLGLIIFELNTEKYNEQIISKLSKYNFEQILTGKYNTWIKNI